MDALLQPARRIRGAVAYRARCASPPTWAWTRCKPTALLLRNDSTPGLIIEMEGIATDAEVREFYERVGVALPRA